MKTGDRVLVPFAIGCGECEYCRRDMWSLRGAERVVAIDRIPERLAMAQSAGNVIVVDYTQTDNIVETIKEVTDGDGADHCIDAVGMEAHGTGLAADYDKVKQTFRLESDRPTVLRQAIQACRKGGTVSIPGVYSGLIDKLNIGAAFAKGLTLKMGQTHVHRYVLELMRARAEVCRSAGAFQTGTELMRFPHDCMVSHPFPGRPTAVF